MQREIKNEIAKACGGASSWGSGCCRQFTVPLACVSNTDLWKAGTFRTRKLLLFCLSREVPAVYTVVFAYVITTGVPFCFEDFSLTDCSKVWLTVFIQKQFFPWRRAVIPSWKQTMLFWPLPYVGIDPCAVLSEWVFRGFGGLFFL